MKVLVAYDSYFGNTEGIARAVASTLESLSEVEVRKTSELQPSHLVGVDWLILGSPTRAFRASDATNKLLGSISPGRLTGIKVAVFDTRIPEPKMPGFLRLIVKVTGYAAEKMAKALAARGAEVMGQPGQFYVLGSEGPLVEGELKRAADWARSLKVG